MYSKLTQFANVKIGQEFTFVFDRTTEWRYCKVGFDTVECVSCPSTYFNVKGQVDRWYAGDCNVVVHLEHEEECA